MNPLDEEKNPFGTEAPGSRVILRLLPKLWIALVGISSYVAVFFLLTSYLNEQEPQLSLNTSGSGMALRVIVSAAVAGFAMKVTFVERVCMALAVPAAMVIKLHYSELQHKEIAEAAVGIVSICLIMYYVVTGRGHEQPS